MQEGELEFDFGMATAEKFDDPAKQRPQGMQFVDFLIEESERLILLEIKDPSRRKAKGGNAKAEAALERERIQFVEKLRNNGWIADELTPKARDSYTYLHLMRRDDKPILYVLLLGTDRLPFDAVPLLPDFKDRLLARLRQEMDQPWLRQYVSDCLVLTEQTWPIAFPDYPLTRTP
jgi:hypothetical protein